MGKLNMYPFCTSSIFWESSTSSLHSISSVASFIPGRSVFFSEPRYKCASLSADYTLTQIKRQLVFSQFYWPDVHIFIGSIERFSTGIFPEYYSTAVDFATANTTKNASLRIGNTITWNLLSTYNASQLTQLWQPMKQIYTCLVRTQLRTYHPRVFTEAKQ